MNINFDVSKIRLDGMTNDEKLTKINQFKNITEIETKIQSIKEPCVNARDLHKALNIKKDFSDWIKQQIQRASLILDTDYVLTHQKGVKSNRGRPTKDYILTVECAKIIIAKSNTEIGNLYVRYLIAVEDAVREKSDSGDTEMAELLKQAFEISKQNTILAEEKAEAYRLLYENKPLLKLSYRLVKAINAKRLLNEGENINTSPYLLKYTTFISDIGLHNSFAKKNADEVLKDLGIIYRNGGSFRSEYREGVELYDKVPLFIYPAKRHRNKGALCVHPDGILKLAEILHNINVIHCKKFGLKIEYTFKDFEKAYNRALSLTLEEIIEGEI